MSNVRSATIRKAKRDPGFTPTEKAQKERLMRQFVSDGPKGNSAAYRNAPCWCVCGRLKAGGGKKCVRCLARGR